MNLIENLEKKYELIKDRKESYEKEICRRIINDVKDHIKSFDIDCELLYKYNVGEDIDYNVNIKGSIENHLMKIEKNINIIKCPICKKGIYSLQDAIDHFKCFEDL